MSLGKCRVTKRTPIYFFYSYINPYLDWSQGWADGLKKLEAK
jgi:hypothetical protein